MEEIKQSKIMENPIGDKMIFEGKTYYIDFSKAMSNKVNGYYKLLGIPLKCYLDFIEKEPNVKKNLNKVKL